jgi:hypothetical protein
MLLMWILTCVSACSCLRGVCVCVCLCVRTHSIGGLHVIDDVDHSMVHWWTACPGGVD